MPIEIERKFLVLSDRWRLDCAKKETQRLRQGYLAKGNVTVRIRICGNGESASLAIKGPRQQVSRLEYEFPIPVAEAEEILCELAPQSLVEKTRHTVFYRGKLWNLDEFGGAHAGLVLAEIELTDPAEQFDTPNWIGKEVTGDERYRNSVLAEVKPVLLLRASKIGECLIAIGP